MHLVQSLNAGRKHRGSVVLLAKTYPPVGFCIYCGAREWAPGQDRKLGDEHIVPEGLGGKLLLPDASCKICEEETSSFEIEWLRGSFYSARVQKGLGKKKKRPPTHLPLKVHVGGRTVVKQIRLDKYPAMVVTLLFDHPGILSVASPTAKELSGGVAMGILPTFGEHLKEHLAQGKVTFVPPRATATSVPLGRMLAKIAHAYAVAEYGLSAFTPFLRSIIRGADISQLAHFVGGTRDIPQISQDVYELELKTVKSSDRHSCLLATIRLLADVQGMPEYWVVVGELSSEPGGAPSDIVI